MDESACDPSVYDDSIEELRNQLQEDPVEQPRGIEPTPDDTDDLEEEDAEENDISRKGIEHALSIAHNAEQHAKDVEEMLGYLGCRMEKSLLTSWEMFLSLHVVDKDLMIQLIDFSHEIKVKHDCKFKSDDLDSIRNIPRNSSHSQDSDIDTRWDVFVEGLTRISNDVIISPTLTKPTGNLRAPPTILWNYPSWDKSPSSLGAGRR